MNRASHLNMQDLIREAGSVLQKVRNGIERATDLDDCLSENTKGTLRVYIAGPDKSGKSTLVNVLLRRPAAKTGVTPVAIPDNVKEYPWGRHLLCDTMGYLADRSAGMPKRISGALGRAAVVVFIMHPEGPGPSERELIKYVHGVGVPLLLVVNRIDTVPDQDSAKEDIEGSIRRSMAFLASDVPIVFVSLKRAIARLEATDWKGELPEDSEQLESCIQTATAQADQAPLLIVQRRALEHLRWVLKQLDEDGVNQAISVLKRLQSEVIGKYRWLRTKRDSRIEDQLAIFDKHEDAIVAAVDAADKDLVEAASNPLNEYSKEVVQNFDKCFHADIEEAVNELAMAVRETAERFTKAQEATDPGEASLNGEAINDAGSAAAEALKAFNKTTQDAIENLARLAIVLRNRLLIGGASFPAIEIVEEGVKLLMPSSAQSTIVAVDAATPVTQAGTSAFDFSAQDIGNALQAFALVITAVLFIKGLIEQRKKIEAARKNLMAQLYAARNKIKSLLEGHGTNVIKAKLNAFDQVLNQLADDAKLERETVGSLRSNTIRLIEQMETF